MKRSAWRYLFKSEDIRKKLLSNIIVTGAIPVGSKHSGSWD